MQQHEHDARRGRDRFASELKEEEKRPEPVELLCCVVGSSGTGKSSLLGLYCGRDRVRAGGGVLAVTTTPEVFNETNFSQRVWMDTMGAEDSTDVDTGLIDDRIFQTVWKEIFKQKPQQMKILWVVKVDHNRMTSTLQRQARFIQSFGEGISGNVWDSVLVVTRKNRAFEERIPGVLAAAAKFGARTTGNLSLEGEPLGSVQCVGYTCLDWLTGIEREERLEDVEDMSRERRFQRGLLFEQEIVSVIDEHLNAISSIPVRFEIQKCGDCGTIGDPRAVPLECHDRKRMVHPDVNQPLIHTAAETFYHTASIIPYHLKSTTSWFHPGSPTSESYNSGSEHTEGKVYHCPKHRSTKTTRRVYLGSPSTDHWYTCAYCSSRYHSRTTQGENGELNHCYVCCDNSSHRGSGTWPSSQCAGAYCHRCATLLYGCCHESSGSGCTTTTSTRKGWSCCRESSSSSGCRERHDCCEVLIHHPGCEYKYSCCSKSSSAQGCYKMYNCCSVSCRAEQTVEGCRLRCCRQKTTADGCSAQCGRCKRGWGASKGCTIRFELKRDTGSFHRMMPL